MRVLDLFSGIGGFSLGLESVGMRTIGFCEIEPFPRAVLAEHWPSIPIHDDIRTLSAESVPWLRAEASAGGIDLICGGFPCQDISVAGKGAGLAGARSGLWGEYARLVGELRPAWVLAENVGALRTRGVDRVCADLEAEGYAVWPLLVGAWAVGAPHRRERVWIVAHRTRDGQRGESAQERAERERAGARGQSELSNSDPGRRGRTERALQAGRDEPVGTAVVHAYGAGRREHCRAVAVGSELACAERSGELPEPEGERRPQQGNGRHAGSRLGCDGPRWPARPGEPQHEWEEPRLVVHANASNRGGNLHGQAPSNGGRESGLAERCASAGQAASGSPEQPMGSAAHGLPERLARRANREALRALGNSVVPAVVAAIGRAILAADSQMTDRGVESV